MAGLDPKVVDELLDKLSSDDGFRALYASDPSAALRSVGHEGEDPPCMEVKALASKETILQARDELRDTLLGALHNIPHKLEG
jgi:putative modified peptide